MKKKLFIFLWILIFVVLATGYASFRLYFVSPSKTAAAVSFEIAAGENLETITKNLKEKGLLKNPFLFKWYLKKNKIDTKIQSGIFELKPDSSVKSLAKILTDPNAASIKLTFLEGWNLRDAAYYLENQGLFQAEELQEAAGFPTVDYRFVKDMPLPKNFSAQFEFLKDKPSYLGLEGYLFPDTYFFKKNVTIEEIIRAMLANFNYQVGPDLLAEIKRQNKTLNEAVIVASLVEAEAREEKDRRLVSDIICRRLAIGLPLQLDSTVNYITGAKKPAISLKEQAIDSPYNTYRYAGLPLGPINNPGLSSILAAVYPEKNDYWFFLSGKDGRMRYAKSLKEQESNREMYLR